MGRFRRKGRNDLHPSANAIPPNHAEIHDLAHQDQNLGALHQLPPFISGEIESLREGYGRSDKNFLFFGTTAITKNPIVEQPRRHCAMAGIPIISPHEIRHAVASWLVANCKDMSDLIVVQRWLGHSSRKETPGTYSHYMKKSDRSVSSVLETIQSI